MERPDIPVDSTVSGTHLFRRSFPVGGDERSITELVDLVCRTGDVDYEKDIVLCLFNV